MENSNDYTQIGAEILKVRKYRNREIQFKCTLLLPVNIIKFHVLSHIYPISLSL